MANSPCGCPYEGAKESYLLDIEDRDLTERVLTLAEAATSVPKPRKRGEGRSEQCKGRLLPSLAV